MNKSPAIIALIKKDWGLNRVPIYGGLLLIASPYIVAGAFAPTAHEPWRRQQICDSFMLAAVMADILTLLLAAVFGGAALAQERRERWADFLAMMPISRARIVASKLIVATLVLGAMWGINFAVFAIAYKHRYVSPGVQDNVYNFAVSSVGLLMLFGVAWLFSSFLSSPAVAAIVSIAMGCGAVFWPGILPTAFRDRINVPATLMFAIDISMGLLGLAIGTYHYLRRVEP